MNSIAPGSSRKRKEGELLTTPVAVSSTPDPVNRARKSTKSRSSATDVKHTETIQHKKALYRQGIESVNQQHIDLVTSNPQAYKELDLHSKMVFVSCLANEVQFFHNLYDRPVGHVVSMGQGDMQQLGIFHPGDDPDAEPEVLYPPTICRSLNASKSVVQVAAGGLHSLALTQDGRVYSWGCNDDGALGRITTDSHQTGLVTQIAKGFRQEDENEIAMVTCGDSHSLFLSLRGNVYMTGMYKDVDSGKFCNLAPGETNPQGSKFEPTKIDLFDQPVKSIASGASFNAAILQDHSMVTWGMGHAGELARSDDMTTATLDKKTGKRTYDLGKSYYGEVYLSDEKDKKGNRIEKFRYKADVVREHFIKPKPPRWAGPRIKRCVINVGCGSFHLMVAARDPGQTGSVLYTSGLNNYGQLGHGDNESRHELTPVEALRHEDIVQVAGGEHFSIALNTFGNKLFAFGRSDYGQLGLFSKPRPSGDFEPTPKRVAFPDSTKNEDLRFKEIMAGDRHAMAITLDNDIYTWGFGETGPTGQDMPEDCDANRPQKLDVMWQYRSTNKSTCVDTLKLKRGLNAKVLHAAGGGQHSLLIVERYD